MSNYTQVTFFAPKDALLSGDPNKIIHGTQVDPELAAIAVAITSKFDVQNMGSIAQLAIGSGAVGAPSYAFNADTTSGMFLNAVGVLEFAAAGVKEALIGGGMQLGAPTGGAKGVGTLNATGLYINGTAVSVAGSANPSATIGLSAVNGTAATFMTSDSAPPLSQAISPTWSGTHIFSNAITVNGGGSALKGQVSIAAPSGSVAALVVNTYTGATNYAISVPAPAGIGAYIGLAGNGNTIGSTEFLLAQDSSGNARIFNRANSTLDFSTNSLQRVLIAAAGNVTINAPSSGNSLVTNLLQQTLPANTVGALFASTSKAVRITATANQALIEGTDQTGAVSFQPLVIGGNTLTFQIGSAVAAMSINSAGNVSIPAPSSGTALQATGAASGTILKLIAADSASTAATIADGGANATTASWFTTNAGVWIATTGTAAVPFTIRTGGNDRLIVGSAGNVTINAPASGQAFAVTGLANQYAVSILSGNTSGQDFGLTIQAGSTAADSALNVINRSGSITFLNLGGDGNGVIGASATAGMQWTNAGAITLNATSGTPLTVKANGTAIFEALGTTSPTVEGYGPTAAGLVDMTPDTGTFTATLTGCTTSPTVTATWTRIGKLVILNIPAVTAVSNATTCTFTGLPAAIQPATLTQLVAAVTEDNGTWADGGLQIQSGSGTMNLYKGGATAVSSFTNVGTKGWPLSSTVAYLLN